ncbi:hypothetical protein Bca52824_074613 [Brassica carinata]|uniref:DUF4283 domain-containing protein n=1 Tax=Brassica carinata TaxID=52824 RepID=A0A8X7PMU6_BRACI|nr:hypothetical protein Bca52824_074613 [Brassica carinata]
MNRRFGSRAREDNDGQTRRRLKENEEAIIRVPAFDNSDLIAKFKQTLSGRVFHSDGRSVEALLKHMPKRRIWDVEGQVRGTNLGNNKFHFDFDREEDLIKVLEKRPCHFNKWSFSLERWTPTIKEDFPNSLPFWAVVSGVPIHYKKQETYESVGKALGVFDKGDVEGSRVRVFVNGDLPLKFDCKIGFANGDVVKVTIQYEDLYRHCFSCKRLSHEEGTCPELNEDQRARNRLARIEQKEKEERATKEAFSIPQRQTSGAYIDSYRHESRGGETRQTYQRFPKLRRESRREEENDHDLRKQLKERRELPRNRDRYHPYQHNSGAISKERTRDTASSSEWRPKRPQRDKYDKQPARPWNQTNTSSRSRRSPDSQRTISDNPRRQSSHAHARGRNSHSPPSGTLEWRPLSENDDAEKTASRRSNTEVYEPVRDKQTNISLNDTGKERENEVDTNMSIDKEPPIDTRDNVKQDPKNKASAQQTSTLGKKRGVRSPDLKGASASRKRASRGRFSPKSKAKQSQCNLQVDFEVLSQSPSVALSDVCTCSIRNSEDVAPFICATNSVNRRSKRGGKGEAVHNGGAKTREEREIEMTAEWGGVPPDWLELMRDMHTNKQTGEVQDPVARELLATLKINQLVLENVPIKKGRRYGIGRTSEAISTSSSQHSVSSSSILQYIDRMKTELDEERTKRRAIEEELRRVTVFISNLCPEQFSATQTQPDSATQSPDDRCF